jgi:hypothetical protein
MFNAITFSEFNRLLTALGFDETRVKGSESVSVRLVRGYQVSFLFTIHFTTILPFILWW